MSKNSDQIQKTKDLAEVLSQASLKNLCEENSSNYSLTINGLRYDFSKQLLTEETLQHLLAIAEQVGLKQKIANLLTGELVNLTEGRAALHTALREPQDSERTSKFASTEINTLVHQELDKLENIVDALRAGAMQGATGRAFTDVVFLGVGGSNLGPQFVLNALHEFDHSEAQVPNVHLVSAMDGIQLARLLKGLNAETSLMVVCSKSFGTKDTLLNAETMLSWFAEHLASNEKALMHHALGISSNSDRMDAFGIPKDKQLALWDWVGGRFSFWSTVGLPIALRLGMENFRQLLAGAHAADQHFAEAELAENIPVIMGLLSYWNTSFLHKGRNMVLPYDARLESLPEYLAQLHMESLGKHTTLDCEIVEIKTGSKLWGGLGTNSQHSFYQLLHQGTEEFFADFLMVEKAPNYSEYTEQVKADLDKQFRYAHANCLAQSDLMAFGQENTDPNHYYPGNHPSVMLTLKELTPYSLGQLVALYEHRTYVNAVLLNINAFDQYGVELGKVMAEEYFQNFDN